MEDQRQWVKYCQILREWATPQQLKDILDAVGTPKEARELIEILKARKKVWDWNTEGQRRLRAGLAMFGIIGAAGAGLVALRTVIIWLLATPGQ